MSGGLIVEPFLPQTGESWAGRTRYLRREEKRGWALSLLLIWPIFSGFAVMLYVAVDLLVSCDETLYPFLTPS
jgi:hypothetical protein